MIDRGEIEEVAGSLGVHTSNVQRDYVNGWLLSKLYSTSPLANRLVLKGGNCLRKGYFVQGRYSDDLDFSTQYSLHADEIREEFDRICEKVHDAVGVDFDKSKTRITPKRSADEEKQISEVRLYFRDFYGVESSMTLKVKLDITEFDKLYLPVQTRSLIHPYSDASECSVPVACVKLEEVLASKMRCLLQRRHIPDLYDLVYPTLISKEIPVDRSELLWTFFRITIFQASPAVAKGLFLSLPWEAIKRYWQTLSCPEASRFTFDKALGMLEDLIHAIIPGDAQHSQSAILFPSALRNPIAEAAASQTMLRLRYHGVERLVEPYSLEYKRRKDGVAREYFYAFDTTGGRTSGPSMKAFVAGSVENIATTDRKFAPRFEIEISKAGGAETAGQFKGKVKPILPDIGFVSSFYSRKANKRIFRIMCPSCERVFTRTTNDVMLRAHNDDLGDPCRARRGVRVTD